MHVEGEKKVEEHFPHRGSFQLRSPQIPGVTIQFHPPPRATQPAPPPRAMAIFAVIGPLSNSCSLFEGGGVKKAASEKKTSFVGCGFSDGAGSRSVESV